MATKYDYKTAISRPDLVPRWEAELALFCCTYKRQREFREFKRLRQTGEKRLREIVALKAVVAKEKGRDELRWAKEIKALRDRRERLKLKHSKDRAHEYEPVYSWPSVYKEWHRYETADAIAALGLPKMPADVAHQLTHCELVRFAVWWILKRNWKLALDVKKDAGGSDMYSVGMHCLAYIFAGGTTKGLESEVLGSESRNQKEASDTAARRAELASEIANGNPSREKIRQLICKDIRGAIRRSEYHVVLVYEDKPGGDKEKKVKRWVTLSFAAPSDGCTRGEFRYEGKLLIQSDFLETAEAKEGRSNIIADATGIELDILGGIKQKTIAQNHGVSQPTVSRKRSQLIELLRDAEASPSQQRIDEEREEELGTGAIAEVDEDIMEELRESPRDQIRWQTWAEVGHLFISARCPIPKHTWIWRTVRFMEQLIRIPVPCWRLEDISAPQASPKTPLASAVPAPHFLAATPAQPQRAAAPAAA
jgi:hypothetical protein